MPQKTKERIIQRQMEAWRLSTDDRYDADKRKAFSEISRIGYKYLEPLGHNILSYLQIAANKSSPECRQAKIIFQCKQMLQAWLNPSYRSSSDEGLSRKVLQGANADQALEAWMYMKNYNTNEAVKNYNTNEAIKFRIKEIQENLRQETDYSS